MFIITDKAVYKGGDTIHFRVLVLDYKLFPKIHNNELNIQITDPQKNLIKKWSNQNTPLGVFSSDFILGMSPILGTWTINATIMNTEYIRNITVEEYELPQFNVIINTQRHISLNSGKIVAKVQSRYSFGKPVKGTLTLSARPTDAIDSTEPAESKIVRQKTSPTNGETEISFNIAEELFIEIEDKELDVILEANVIEELTGRYYNTTTIVSLHLTKYLIDFVSDTSGYIPGFSYTSWVKIFYHDGTPVIDKTNEVIVKYSFEDEGTAEDRLILDDRGMTKFNFDGKPINILQTIEVNYLDAAGYHHFPKKTSDNNVYLQAKIKTLNPTVGQDISILIKSTNSMSYFIYQVISRGILIKGDTVTVRNKKYHLLKFPLTFDMVPKAKFLIYFICEDGQMVYDVININLPSTFQNNIKIHLSTEHGEPSNNISITVKTKPNSFVGILGVDQKVLFLKKGNNLDVDDIFKDLSNYEGEELYSNTGFSDLENAGAAIITNVRPSYIPDPDDEDSDANTLSLSSFKSSSTKTRKDFPETWIWETIENNGLSGETILHKKIPDTITTWLITGFSISSEYGFGMTYTPKKLQVFKEFFISTNLPYSIKQGEIVSIPIVVFNYKKKPITASVILDNSLLEFDFTELSNEAPGGVEDSRNKIIRIEANTGASVFFMIKPKINGYVTIKIKAQSETDIDDIENKLLVLPEGIPKFVDQTVLIDLRDQNEMNKIINIVVPTHAVPNSTRIQLTVFGDLFGPTVKNLNYLIRLPTGCAEQTTSKLVPNIIVLNYLEKTNELSQSLRATAINYMTSGYQNLLRHKQSDGSFAGYLTLSAYIIKSLIQAQKYIQIEEHVISNGLSWLNRNQAASGAFNNVGYTYSHIMQDASQIPLTAFTLLPFLESQKYKNLYASTITKGTNFISNNLANLDDSFGIAVSTLCLQLAQHRSKDIALQKLRSKAITGGGTTYWCRGTNTGANSVNIEITGYALLAYLEANLVSEALPIVNWLVAQFNGNGGFKSTQDTVIALQALAKFPVARITPGYNVRITAQNNGNQLASYEVNKINAMVLQSRDLPSNLREVNLSGTGSGIALARISYQYNEGGVGTGRRFELDTTVSANTTKNYLHITVCAKFIPQGNEKLSGMSLIEVSLPSGFTIDDNSLLSLKYHKVTQYDTKDSKTVAVLYFDNLNQVRCPGLAAFRTFKVADLKPTHVTVYDYYDTSRNARVFYKIQEAILCDICEGDNCGSCANSQ